MNLVTLLKKYALAQSSLSCIRLVFCKTGASVYRLVPAVDVGAKLEGGLFSAC